ncbi:hypothetical protein JHD46_08260 [Sulfurimonas sp. SAG-AH-194-C20]|nr:hypothetical protein [Sulfurimonas sp. SAG-AH-194-C20]MDF1879628.1 hypothetical protein [Sulfurimonas sp. SAG-AH-194-C20]
MKNCIYFIPGRHAKLTSSLGNAICEFGFSIMGRELIDDFMQLRISKQVILIQEDLEEYFWHKDAKLIAYSYGGYLLLHALASMKAFPGKILLIAPVLGMSKRKANALMSRPPWAMKLLEYSQNSTFPPLDLEVHTGQEDSGCDPELANTIVQSIDGAKLFIVAGEGHNLDKVYVSSVLKKFLETNDSLKV